MIVWYINTILLVQFHLLWWGTPVLLACFIIGNYTSENGMLAEIALLLSTFLLSVGIYLAFTAFYRAKGLVWGIRFLLIVDLFHSLLWGLFGLPLTFIRLAIPIILCIYLLYSSRLDNPFYELRWGFIHQIPKEKVPKRSYVILFSGASILLAFSIVFWFISVNYMIIMPESAKRLECLNNFKQILIGLHEYQDHYGTLPPAWTVDHEGKILHSWRVLLLPFINDWTFAKTEKVL